MPDFQCAGCLFEEDGFTPRPIVVMYMSDERVCNNIEAVKVLKKQGRLVSHQNFMMLHCIIHKLLQPRNLQEFRRV